MKINSIKTTTGYLHKGIERSKQKERECAKERAVLKQNNIDQINTTIESNSDGRVSFKGWAQFLHGAAEMAGKNPILAEALFAGVVTCTLRPLTILATARTEDEKDKCTYQAAKSISTGVVGVVMSFLVSTPLKWLIDRAEENGATKIPKALETKSQETVQKGVDMLSGYVANIANNTEVEETFIGQIKDLIKDNKFNVGIFKDMGKGAEKAFGKKLKKRAPEVFEQYVASSKAQNVLNNYSGISREVCNKSILPVFLIAKAMITVALIPVILNAFGIKKGGKKPKEAEVQQKTQQESKQEVKQEIKQSEIPNQVLQPSARAAYESLKFNMFQGNSDRELFNHFAEVAKYEN